MATDEVTEASLMASPGDRIVVRGHRLGDGARDGEILAVLGQNGRPPYLVRWSDDGHVSRLFPGPDAFVEHFASPEERSLASESPGRSEHVGEPREEARP